MRSSPALQSASAVPAVLDSPSETHGRPAPSPGCLAELACPGPVADINSSLGRNPGLLFGSAHDLHRHEREKWVRRNALGVNPLPFQAGEPAGEKGPAPLPSPLRSHSTVGLPVSGRGQGDRRSARAHSLLVVHMALHDLCHNEFQIPRGTSLGTRAHGVRGDSGPVMSPAFPRKAASSPPPADGVRMGGN